MKRIRFVIALAITLGVILACNSNEVTEKGTKKETVTKDNQYYFKRGKDYFDKDEFSLAKIELENISDKDSSYTEAQKMLEICKREIEKRNKKMVQEKRKVERKEAQEESEDERLVEKLEKKYERLCKSGYQYEVEQKLLRAGFHQDKTEFEEAPDGSTQVASYYSKIENGYKVRVKLIPSYSLSSHYSWVTVE